MNIDERREKPLIQVQNLGKSFGNVQVLKDISLDIYEGDVVFVVGPSGSGKSTFLRCLNRLEEPTERTSWTGEPTSTGTAREWAWCSSTSTSSPT